jgi:methionine-R-sulfoxide reductase
MNNMKFNDLTPEEENVILKKDTETPFSNEYFLHFDKGVYKCKRCNSSLYRSKDKFFSNCGWPSFDEEIKGAVKRVNDPDGIRTEILCSKCGGHLGHIFKDEGLTPKNIRHCVNSLALSFDSEEDSDDRDN